MNSYALKVTIIGCLISLQVLLSGSTNIAKEFSANPKPHDPRTKAMDNAKLLECIDLIERREIRYGMTLSELKVLIGDALIPRSKLSFYVILSRWNLPENVQSPPVWEIEFSFNTSNELIGYSISIPKGK